MMNKKEYQIYEKAIKTGEMIEKRFFEQKERLKTLYDYIIIRKQQLDYSETKEEMTFISGILLEIIREA